MISRQREAMFEYLRFRGNRVDLGKFLRVPKKEGRLVGMRPKGLVVEDKRRVFFMSELAESHTNWVSYRLAIDEREDIELWQGF
jgi:hypothetical protein